MNELWHDLANYKKGKKDTLSWLYDNMSRDELLLRWAELKTELEKAKTLEMELRKYIVKREFSSVIEGINNIELGNGYKLKATLKYNYVIDNNKIDSALDELAKINNEGSFIAERIVKWKADLVLKEYRELEPQYKKIIDEVLTIKDAAPTLEIVEPKVK